MPPQPMPIQASGERPFFFGAGAGPGRTEAAGSRPGERPPRGAVVGESVGNRRSWSTSRAVVGAVDRSGRYHGSRGSMRIQSGPREPFESNDHRRGPPMAGRVQTELLGRPGPGPGRGVLRPPRKEAPGEGAQGGAGALDAGGAGGGVRDPRPGGARHPRRARSLRRDRGGPRAGAAGRGGLGRPDDPRRRARRGAQGRRGGGASSRAARRASCSTSGSTRSRRPTLLTAWEDYVEALSAALGPDERADASATSSWSGRATWPRPPAASSG